MNYKCVQGSLNFSTPLVGLSFGLSNAKMYTKFFDKFQLQGSRKFRPELCLNVVDVIWYQGSDGQRVLPKRCLLTKPLPKSFFRICSKRSKLSNLRPALATMDVE